MDRRAFVGRMARLGGGLLWAPSVQGLVAACRDRRGVGPAVAAAGEGGYGELVPAGPELALPRGFRYAKFGVEGSPMSDGLPTPRAHDGMAAFALPDGRLRLVRNHEDRDPASVARARGDPSKAYDPRAGGGTTTLELRVAPDGTPELVRDFLSLNGTLYNCAGGPTPWGSWLSCEETTQGEAQGRERDHGYVFEVPASADDEVDPVPLKALGRFVHEAVAVDPWTGTVYETEDRDRAGFYRFVPAEPGRLLAGGRLEMLAVVGAPGLGTFRGQRMGARWRVRWVAIPEPDPPEAETEPDAVARQGWAQGAAVFSRLEGCWWGDGGVYFHATDGGDAGRGQVWFYRPDPEGGELVLVFESPGPEVLDGPDNITVSPRGGILICEDGADGNCLRGLTPDGRIFDFARNIANEREFAGACFSPDGRFLFVNVQGDTRTGGPGHLGMTFAVWGPWERGAL